MGPFYADILCFSEALVIEVDVDTHADAAVYDLARTQFLRRKGYRVIRFANNDVMENVEGAIATIAKSLSQREREGAAKPRKGEDSELRLPSPRPICWETSC